MQSTVMDEVSAVSEAVAKEVGSQKYRIWFKNSTKFMITDGYLKIDVPNHFVASWIDDHFSNQISSAVRRVIGRDLKLTFSIDPELSGHQRRSQLDCQADVVTRTVPEMKGRLRTRKQPVSRKNLKLSLDSFVVGPSNELAFNAAKTVSRADKSVFNPLFIHGGYGVGKTHLLQGICNRVCASQSRTNWLYLSAEDFANQFILALKTKKLEAFRRRMRQTDLLAIDDIHFLASKPSTQEEFLYTFNTIDLAGKQVILASDAHPKMIGQLSEKLVNRFVSGMVVKINMPDFKTRCEICRQHALSMGRKIPENVIRYISEHLKTSVRELEGALLKLVAFSALQNDKITLALAKEVLAEHLARTDPIVQVSDIESAVAMYFGITPANIHSSKKSRTIALARHFAMYLARKLTKMSLPEIGRCVGNKNHATVLLACRKVEEHVTQNAELNWQGPEGNRLVKARTILNSLKQAIEG